MLNLFFAFYFDAAVFLTMNHLLSTRLIMFLGITHLKNFKASFTLSKSVGTLFEMFVCFLEGVKFCVTLQQTINFLPKNIFCEVFCNINVWDCDSVAFVLE